MIGQLGTTGLLLVCTTLVVGCAGKSAGSAELVTEPFRVNVGRATSWDVGRRTPQVLERYHYVIQRSDSSSSQIYIETRWRHRAPFAEEEALGISSARSRIIIRARGGRGTLGSAALMTVEFTMENMLLDHETGVWREGTATEMFRKYANEIADRLKEEFLSGIRVF
jgi:hypothetical protein